MRPRWVHIIIRLPVRLRYKQKIALARAIELILIEHGPEVDHTGERDREDHHPQCGHDPLPRQPPPPWVPGRCRRHDRGAGDGPVMCLQYRHLTLQPANDFLGSHKIAGRGQQLRQQLIDPAALALKIIPMTARQGVQPGDLSL